MYFSTFIATAALCLLSSVQGLSIPRAKLDVFVPTIISPNETTVWVIGRVEKVIWDPSNAPQNISNGASVALYTPFTKGHELVQVLVKGFDLRSGSVDVTVPANLTAGVYTITLFGDSGDWSPDFNITTATVTV